MEIEKVVGKDTTIVKDNTKRGIRIEKVQYYKGMSREKMNVERPKEELRE
jgi:hypothetical protein